MGNFRGIYPRKKADWRKQESYWDDVTVQNYAEKDIDAFIQKIRETKKKDLEAILKENGIVLSEREIYE